MKSLVLWTLLVPLAASNVITANLREPSFSDKAENFAASDQKSADGGNLDNSIVFLGDLDFSDPEALELRGFDDGYDHFPKSQEWVLTEAISTLLKKLSDLTRLLNNLTDLKSIRREDDGSSTVRSSDKATSDSAFNKMDLIEVVTAQAARFDDVEGKVRHFQFKGTSPSPFDQLADIVTAATKATDSEFPKLDNNEGSDGTTDKPSPSDAITAQIMGTSSTGSPATKNDDNSGSVLEKIKLSEVVTSTLGELDTSEPLASNPDEMARSDSEKATEEAKNSSESLLAKENLSKVITSTFRELEASETASELSKPNESTIPESEGAKVDNEGKSETFLDRVDLSGVIATELAKLDKAGAEHPDSTNQTASQVNETPAAPLASLDIADFRSYNQPEAESATDNLDDSNLSQSPVLPLLNHPISGGKFTFYQAQGKGACGLDCGRCSAAISARLFDPAAKWGPSGGKYILKDAVCLGMCVRIEYKGRSASFPIDDKCPECPPNHVDLSEHAFLALEPNAAVGVGRDATITYMFCNQTRISSC